MSWLCRTSGRYSWIYSMIVNWCTWLARRLCNLQVFNGTTLSTILWFLLTYNVVIWSSYTSTSETCKTEIPSYDLMIQSCFQSKIMGCYYLILFILNFCKTISRHPFAWLDGTIVWLMYDRRGFLFEKHLRLFSE